MEDDGRKLGLMLSVLGAATATITLAFAVTWSSSLALKVASIGAERVFQPLQMEDASLAILGISIGAGIALGLSGLGTSLGMGTASAAALGAITERPETFGKSILYVVFIEAVAVYGFVIAFLLVGYIPSLIP
ncbi:hypothetical protein EU546_06800 [Candidatus Thorarchaeota archaeon]|jgi:V/A-type H+-transporting ATPase subunit K|nr:MAG: hypothetical protein EU546_06800 [Candidatus Thorarchaeota archaeon]